MYIYGFSTAILGMCLFDRTDEIALKYPDLDDQEIALVANYLDAYEGREQQPKRYATVKTQVLQRMRKLQRDFTAAGGDARLPIVAKLVDYNQLMRETNVAPHAFSSLNQCDPQFYARACEANDDIPEEVKAALDVESRDGNFLDYVSRHVRQVFFVEHLGEHVQILNSDIWTGTAEEATRSVVIDTFDEELRAVFEPWQMAATMVHEAAHISYFYLFANDPKRQKLDRAERYATIAKFRYIYALVKDVHTPEKIKQKAESALNGVLSEIQKFNRRLGWDISDYSLTK